MKPIISIVIPIYRVEKYLHRCIESVLNQSFTKFELILVNDGSPDNCGAICDEYAKNDSRIKVIHKENGGLSDARNAGLEIAEGDFIGFVDSDDFINKDMYKILYELIEKNNSNIVQCNLFKVEDELNQNNIECENYQYKNYSNIEAIDYLMQDNIFKVSVCNKLYRRELFDKLRFRKGKLHEDEFIMYKLFFYCKKITYVDCNLYYYYKNNNGIMLGSNIVKRFDRIEALEERSEFFCKNNNLYLYNKSNAALLFALTKLQFILIRNNEISEKKKYSNILRKKIQRVCGNLTDNNELTMLNRNAVKLININYYFVFIYYLNNYLLHLKYKLQHRY